MALVFKRVPEVAIDDPVTSTQINAMATADNDRLRSIGDLPWRVCFYILNGFRQVRNPDTSGGGLALLWPSMFEMFKFYVHLDPYIARADWPIVDPGFGTGANLSCPFMGFHFGNPITDPEHVRLEVVPLKPDDSIEAIWELGKVQRGQYDPVTGHELANAFAAAQSYYKIQQLTPDVWVPVAGDDGVVRISLSGSGSIVHGKSYGGYLPLPEYLGDCGDATEDQPPTPNHRIFFTPIRPGLQEVSFPGTCPNVNGHVRFIGRTPPAYFVYVWGSNIPVALRTKDYIEGPYRCGGALTKSDGDHLTRMGLAAYVKDYRGSVGEIASPGYSIEDFGFDVERFNASQYLLSPNIGHWNGSFVVRDLPQFFLAGEVFQAGQVFSHVGGGTTHAYEPGFVLGSAFFKCTKLIGAAIIEAIGTNGKVLKEIVLTDDVPGQIVTFPDGPHPSPLSFRLKSLAVFEDATGRIDIECTEQLEYKPDIHDQYLVLRLSTTTGDSIATVDGDGTRYLSPKILSDAYFDHGLILNRSGAPGLPLEGVFINDKPVYEAARRLCRDLMRLVPRAQVLKYAVENGKSCLWFARYALGENNMEVDSFHNIAPPIAATLTGEITEGETYIVRATSGHVTYGPSEAPVNYSNGQKFTGLAGLKEFAHTGDARPWIYDGIRHVALKQGTTNQHLMNVEFKPWHWSESSQWKPAAMADYFSLCDRCHFWSLQIRGYNNPDLRFHFNYGISRLISPEAPSGYRYAGTSNQFFQTSDAQTRTWFYKSCRIYEPWPELESCIVDTPGANEVIKLTFKSRFHCCSPADFGIGGDISSDMNTWSPDQLTAEPYRSLENGIRQYLYHIHTGGIESETSYKPLPKIGDNGAESDIRVATLGPPYASIYPDFLFCRLAPLQYEDGNDVIDPDRDSKIVMDIMQQMELHQRAYCEAFLDGTTTQAYGCSTCGQMLGDTITASFDFTWDNLLFDAFGGRSQGPMSSAQRPDTMFGFSAQTNTVLRAEVFNRMAKVFNKLTRLRMMLPFRLQARGQSYFGSDSIAPNWPPGTICQTDANKKAVASTGLPAASQAFPGNDLEEWDELPAGLGFGSSSFGGFNALEPCFGGEGLFALSSFRTVTHWRMQPTDALALHALPPLIQGLVEGGAVGFLARVHTFTSVPRGIVVSTQAEATPCNFPNQTPTPYFWDQDADGYRFEDDQTNTEVCQLMPPAGVLDAGQPPGGTFYIGHNRSAGGVRCANTSARSVTVTPLVDQTTYIEAELVD